MKVNCCIENKQAHSLHRSNVTKLEIEMRKNSKINLRSKSLYILTTTANHCSHSLSRSTIVNQNSNYPSTG